MTMMRELLRLAAWIGGAYLLLVGWRLVWTWVRRKCGAPDLVIDRLLEAAKARYRPGMEQVDYGLREATATKRRLRERLIGEAHRRVDRIDDLVKPGEVVEIRRRRA